MLLGHREDSLMGLEYEATTYYKTQLNSLMVRLPRAMASFPLFKFRYPRLKID
jgi:hypothetical protein